MKIFALFIGLLGLLNVTQHATFLSMAMLAYGAYAFFTEDYKLVMPRAKVNETIARAKESKNNKSIY